MNQFCTLQTETSCSNRSLTHPTAIKPGTLTVCLLVQVEIGIFE